MGGRASDGFSFISRPFGTMFGSTGGLYGPAGFADMRVLLLLRLHASSSHEAESRGILVQELAEDFQVSSDRSSDYHQHIVEHPDDNVSLTHRANNLLWQESLHATSRDGDLPSEKTNCQHQSPSFHKPKLCHDGVDNLHLSLSAAKMGAHEVIAKISKRDNTCMEATYTTAYLEPSRKQLRI